MEYLEKTASNPKRPKSIYLAFKMPILVLYGFISEAATLGEMLLPMLSSLWCERLNYSVRYYLSISYMILLRDDVSHPRMDAMCLHVQETIKLLEACCMITDVNYRHWISLLSALLAEVQRDPPSALQHYELAMDHTEMNELTLDEAFAHELYAEWMVRKKAYRAARHALKDANTVYREISATGKADHVAKKYHWLYRDAPSRATLDVGCQTTIIDTNNTSFRLEQNEDREQSFATETAVDRTQKWIPGRQESTQDMNKGFSAVGLDMLDLSSILESSQVLSSELKVDKLLAKMASIILESTGGRCFYAAFVGWKFDECPRYSIFKGLYHQLMRS
jgi:hypothetical protein